MLRAFWWGSRSEGRYFGDQCIDGKIE